MNKIIDFTVRAVALAAAAALILGYLWLQSAWVLSGAPG